MCHSEGFSLPSSPVALGNDVPMQDPSTATSIAQIPEPERTFRDSTWLNYAALEATLHYRTLFITVPCKSGPVQLQADYFWGHSFSQPAPAMSVRLISYIFIPHVCQLLRLHMLHDLLLVQDCARTHGCQTGSKRNVTMKHWTDRYTSSIPVFIPKSMFSEARLPPIYIYMTSRTLHPDHWHGTSNRKSMSYLDW
jgi:hypothetical protein